MVMTELRVLLVDDEPALLASMTAVLGARFDVTACASTRVALDLLGRESFHVICADWQMPGMDGIDFFRLLGQRARLGRSGCILMTAHPAELIEQVAWADRKMLGFLSKPFRPADLVDRVSHFATVASMKRSSRALSAAVGRATR